MANFTDDEKNLTFEQATFVKGKKQVINDYLNPYASITKIYGKNGEIPKAKGYTRQEEYKSIVLDPPADMDDATVAAIVLGACMDEERVKGLKTSSTTLGADTLNSNRNRFVDDILLADNRFSNFVPAMIDGRKDAKAALEAYKKGDKTLVNQYLTNYMDFCITASDSAIANNTGNFINAMPGAKTAFLLGRHVYENKEFGDSIIPNINNVNRIARWKSYTKQLDSSANAEINKFTLVNKFDEFSLEDKQTLVEDLLLDSYIANMANLNDQGNDAIGVDGRVGYAFNLLDKRFKTYGIDIQDDEFYGENIFDQNFTKTEYYKLVNCVHGVYADDFDLVFSKPDGREQLKALYLEEIRKTDTYKNIMASASKGEMLQNLIDANTSLGRGLYQFKNVKLPNLSKDINESAYRNTISVELSLSEDIIFENLLNNEQFYGEERDRYMLGLKEDNVKNNIDVISKLVKNLKDNNRWGGSKNNNYTNALRSLEAVKAYAKEMSEEGGDLNVELASIYENKVRETMELIDKYLENKTDINSDYARGRVNAMKRVKRHLKTNILKLTERAQDLEEEKTKEIYKNRSAVFDSLEQRQTFRGDYEIVSSSKKQYTIDRSAGESVATLALIATGKYSFDDIMDPSKLVNEKRAMFVKVIGAMTGGTPKDQKWLAKTIFDGRIAAENTISEVSKTIDFTKPNIKDDVRFCKLRHLTQAQFDAWQEMIHCSDEIVALANEKLGNRFNNYEDYKHYCTSRQSVLGEYSTTQRQEYEACKMVTNSKHSKGNALGRLAHSIVLGKKVLNDVEYEKKHGMLSEEDALKKTIENSLCKNTDAIRKFQNHFKYLNSDPEACMDLMESMLSGKLLKKTKMDVKGVHGKVEDNVNISVDVIGLPTKEECLLEIANVRAMRRSKQAMENLKTKKYNKVSEYMEDVSYALVGRLYEVSGGITPVDASTHKKMSVEDMVRKNIDSEKFKNQIRGKNGKFPSGKTISRWFSDDKYIKKILDKNQKKYKADMAKAKANVKAQPEANGAPKAKPVVKAGRK
ncbi:MAG: hypothetical protein K6F77_06675 [Lachnospiraceae bacterium]|nr:hypothetical protein [Lachnospiraceae bacterium]